MISEQIIEFALLAGSFCQLLEKDPEDKDTWIEELLNALSKVYGSCHLLPDYLDVPETTDFDQFDVSDKEWKVIYNRVDSILKNQKGYWYYFDPSEPKSSEAEPVFGDLADDIADIYRDLKPGTRAYIRNPEKYIDDILLGWKFLMTSHWGVHAVSAMRALHPIAYLRGIQEDHE